MIVTIVDCCINRCQNYQTVQYDAWVRTDESESSTSPGIQGGWDVCMRGRKCQLFVFPASKIPGGRLSARFYEVEERRGRLERDCDSTSPT